MTEFSHPLAYQTIGIYKGLDKGLFYKIRKNAMNLIGFALSAIWFFTCLIISSELSENLSLMFRIKEKFGSVVDFLILLLIFFLIFIIPMIFIIKKAFSILESKLGKKLKSIFGFGDIYNDNRYLALNYFNETGIRISAGSDDFVEFHFIPYLKGAYTNGIKCFTMKGDIIRLKVKSNTDFIEGIDINKIRFRIQGYNTPKERQELVAFLNNQIKSN
jgi:hypothetical protein